MPDSMPSPDRAHRPDNPQMPQPGSGHDAALRPDAPPVEPSGLVPHPRSPEEYTEEPGSHRRAADGAATDVGA